MKKENMAIELPLKNKKDISAYLFLYLCTYIPDILAEHESNCYEGLTRLCSFVVLYVKQEKFVTR